MIWMAMDGFRSTCDFIGISDACLKTFKIPHYGFTMLSLDLTLSHTKDLLGQCIFLSLRILKVKKHPQIKLQRLQKIRILTFGSLVH